LSFFWFGLFGSFFPLFSSNSPPFASAYTPRCIGSIQHLSTHFSYFFTPVGPVGGGWGLVGGRRHFGCVALRCSCNWLTVSFMMMGYE
jgi:hypothetical protein